MIGTTIANTIPTVWIRKPAKPSNWNVLQNDRYVIGSIILEYRPKSAIKYKETHENILFVTWRQTGRDQLPFIKS